MRCGSQVVLCSVPVRWDPYKGCTHNCSWCFVRRKLNDKISLESQIEKGDSLTALKNFIVGERKGELSWIDKDWKFPIHVGGMSDSFQPCEAKFRIMFEALKIFADSQHPFIASTKGRIAAEPEYLDLISKCNAVMQVSLVSPTYNKAENGAPPFEERVKIIEKLSKVAKRTIVRIQPYMAEELDNVLNITLPQVANAGAYGIVVEGMKFYDGKKPGTIQVGADFVYPLNILQPHFEQIRERAHELNLKFFCGENRLRWMGDSLVCCGCEGVPGFQHNTFNLNHIYAGEDPQPTPAMKEVGHTVCFKTLCQSSWASDVLDQLTFENVMREIAKSKFGYNVMGLDTVDKDKTFDI